MSIAVTQDGQAEEPDGGPDTESAASASAAPECILPNSICLGVQCTLCPGQEGDPSSEGASSVSGIITSNAPDLWIGQKALERWKANPPEVIDPDTGEYVTQSITEPFVFKYLRWCYELNPDADYKCPTRTARVLTFVPVRQFLDCETCTAPPSSVTPSSDESASSAAKRYFMARLCPGEHLFDETIPSSSASSTAGSVDSRLRVTIEFNSAHVGKVVCMGCFCIELLPDSWSPDESSTLGGPLGAGLGGIALPSRYEDFPADKKGSDCRECTDETVSLSSGDVSGSSGLFGSASRKAICAHHEEIYYKAVPCDDRRQPPNSPRNVWVLWQFLYFEEIAVFRERVERAMLPILLQSEHHRGDGANESARGRRRLRFRRAQLLLYLPGGAASAVVAARARRWRRRARAHL
jgi:hypothetical protein